MIIYLAGPINGCNDSEANDWRQYLQSRLAGKAAFLDPMRRDYRGREDESVDEIVRGDLEDINASHVVIANCPRPSYGTAMEIFYAHSIGKSVIVVHPTGPVSPWLRKHSARIVHSLEDALSALLELIG